MIAGLLFAIGLVTVIVTIVLVGYGAPGMVQTFTAGLDGGTEGLLNAVGSIAASVAWAGMPLVFGLSLMGFGRVIMLLGAINRSLRGAP